MNPRDALRALLIANVKPQSGAVVEVATDGKSIKVRLASGVSEAKITDATRYIVGDQALIRDGVAQGKVKSIANVQVYYV
jgi:hypothetical protein